MTRGATKQTHIDAVVIKGITKMTMALTEGLIMIYGRLGRPPYDHTSSIFWAMMDNIIQVWLQVFPYEVEEFKKTVTQQKANDRGSLKIDQAGINNQYAIPANLYKMTKTFFPDIKFTDKDFIHKFTTRYPFFKTTEKNL